MRRIQIVLFVLGIAMHGFAQERILAVAQEMPTLQPCASITDFGERRKCTDEQIEVSLAQNLEYPDEARNAGVDGFVLVRFVVDEKGKAVDYVVDEDPGYGMGAAAIKAVKKLGKWTPGRNRGEAVKIRMSVPVRFTLPEAPVVMTMKEPDVYDLPEQMPRYQGCENGDETEARNCTFQSIAQYMRVNLVYPEEAKKQNITGTVIVSFVVDEKGMVTETVVEDSIGGGCDEEAVRLVKAMPQWTPGMHGGKAVKVRQKLPFQFVPTEKE